MTTCTIHFMSTKSKFSQCTHIYFTFQHDYYANSLNNTTNIFATQELFSSTVNQITWKIPSLKKKEAQVTVFRSSASKILLKILLKTFNQSYLNRQRCDWEENTLSIYKMFHSKSTIWTLTLLVLVVLTVANEKSFNILQGNDHPTFIRENVDFYGSTDYAVLSIQFNFTDIHHNCKNLIKKLKSEFSWSNRDRKLGNASIFLYENLDSLVKTENFMRFVEKKVSYIQGKVLIQRDIMSLIFSAGSFLVSLDNRRQLALIKNREKAQTEKLDNLFHIVEHEHDILQRFDDKISKIRSILSKKFNLYRLKFFESEALIYINSLYKDLDNAISYGKTPFALIDTSKVQDYFIRFSKHLQTNGYILYQDVNEFISSKCHITASENGLFKLNYILKIANNGTKFAVHKYMATPIKIMRPSGQANYALIQSELEYLVFDPSNGFSADINSHFFENCIKTNEYTDMTCNLGFKPKGHTCLSSIFHSNLNLDRIRQHCEVKILGMESNLVFLQSRSSAIIFATSVHNLNVRCNN